MAQLDFKNRSARVHDFSMVPRAEIPRSKFVRQWAHKTTFDASKLIPILVDEVLPGDTMAVRMTGFARMSTPVFPLMDNLVLESFFFFVPCRLLWTNWVKFMGEQDNPADSISFAVPQMVSPAGGYPIGSLFDYFGLPTVGQVGGGATVSHNSLPLRAYAQIYNQWFRDENLQNSGAHDVGDGPDNQASYSLVTRGKRHDYFTSCLPWTQKGGTPVSIPLGTTATVRTSASDLVTGAQNVARWMTKTGADPGSNQLGAFGAGSGGARELGTSTTASAAFVANSGSYPTNLFADLTSATAATINQLRQAFQIQKLLERDARGGTRYTELVRSHFGVISPDARLQRPEYLGGGSSPVQIGSVPQTSAMGLTGGTTPQGSLSAFGTVVHHDNGFTQSFTEHGYILGLVSVRADLSYSQGLRKLWSRSTRYDFYFPVFAALGEQAVLNKEIYVVGTPAQDDAVFGYQERWAEYRYFPSMLTSKFRVNAAGTLAAWHLSENFGSLPALNATFIADPTFGTVQRAVAAGAAANGQQFIADFFFESRCARPMPMYSVPGLIDHF